MGSYGHDDQRITDGLERLIDAPLYGVEHCPIDA